MQSQVIKIIGKWCFQEIKYLWSDNYDSLLHTTSVVTMTEFSWESYNGLKFQPKPILKICLPVKTKLNQKPLICLCISMQEKCVMFNQPFPVIVRAGQVVLVLYHLGAVLFRCIKCYRSVCLQLIVVRFNTC